MLLSKKEWKKTHGWKENLLSQAGKEVLIKAVFQALPTYAMSLFLLPKTICVEITSMVRRFWWGGEGKEKGMAWKNWHDMCKHKNDGGMGFQDIELFNVAFLGK